MGTNGQPLTTRAGLSVPYATNSVARPYHTQPYTWNITSLANGWVSEALPKTACCSTFPAKSFYSTDATTIYPGAEVYMPTLTITYNRRPGPA